MKNTKEEARYYIIKDIFETLFRFDTEKRLFYPWHHEGNFAMHSLIATFNYDREEIVRHLERYLIDKKHIVKGEKYDVYLGF